MIESKNVTVLIGEESPLVREGLSHLCRHLGFDVVARCGDGTAVLSAIQRYKPGIAVLDQNLSEISALEIARRLRAHSPQSITRILVLSDRGDRRAVAEALRGGVAGYLLRSATPAEFARAIRSVGKGRLYLSPGLDVEAAQQPLSAATPNGDPMGQLSSREYQVFKFLIDGIRAKEIASRLDISPKTIDTYRANLMRKLDIHDVAGLVKFAIQRELVSL